MHEDQKDTRPPEYQKHEARLSEWKATTLSAAKAATKTNEDDLGRIIMVRIMLNRIRNYF